jgi:hypothetical protein
MANLAKVPPAEWAARKSVLEDKAQALATRLERLAESGGDR